MKNTKRPKRPNGWKALQPTCGGCALFRSMTYKDTGTDAYCGRCTIDKNKIGRVRSSTTMACEKFTPNKEV